jgi:YVTN family beta-propeller protein
MPGPRLADDVYLRRRIVAGVIVFVAGLLLVSAVSTVFGGSAGDGDEAEVAASGEATTSTSTTSTSSTTTTTTPIPASARSLVELDTIGGTISPKSVVASGDGKFVAQNMMYQHTITVYDREFNLLETISDEITPADWGYDFDPSTTLQGAPVEASFSPDGTKAYVSNYHMYGGGYGPEPSDGCNDLTRDPSFVYRIDMESLEIDQVIQVGTVPKYLEVSPDGDQVLVSNWCSYDVSIIDTQSGTETARIDVGRFPRGIAFDPSGDRAYVAIMGGDTIVEIDMVNKTQAGSFGLSGSPRHLNISPDGSTLYATLNRAGEVAKIDLATKQVVDRLATGAAPRSMAISDDGEALYVVNYKSDTMSKVLTDSFEEVQELPVGHHPIGITYDDDTEQVWVANYSGSIMVFEDQPVDAAPAG